MEKDAKNSEIKLSFATKGNVSFKNFTLKLGLSAQLKEGIIRSCTDGSVWGLEE